MIIDIDNLYSMPTVVLFLFLFVLLHSCFVGESSPPKIIPTNQTLVYLANSTGVSNVTVIPAVVTSNKTVDSVIEFWEYVYFFYVINVNFNL
jgi:hypothetical protein